MCIALLRADRLANARSAKGRMVMYLFRFGQGLPRRVQRVYKPFYYLVVDVVAGISLPLETRIGGGLLIRHGQGLVVSWKSTIGTNCEVHQGVTLGEKDGRAPSLGHDVIIGANAVLLGGVHIGDGARVGAGAVVLEDVPNGRVAVGNPARIIELTR